MSVKVRNCAVTGVKVLRTAPLKSCPIIVPGVLIHSCVSSSILMLIKHLISTQNPSEAVLENSIVSHERPLADGVALLSNFNFPEHLKDSSAW